MIAATLHNTTPRQTRADVADASVDGVLRDSVLRAMLSEDRLAAVHVYTDIPEQVSDRAAWNQAGFGHQVAVRHLAELPVLAERHAYVWAATPQDYSTVASMRASLGCELFPASVFVESPLHAADLSWLALALLQGGPWDSLLATSSTTVNILTVAIERSQQSLVSSGLRLGRSPSVVRIPPAVDAAFYRPIDRGRSREALGLRSDRLIVLCPSSLGAARKGALDSLLLLISQLSAAHGEVTLLLASTDDRGLNPGLQALARDLAGQGRLIVRTGLAEHLKPFLYSAADVYLSPEDSLAPRSDLNVLEAMACGLPVVASAWLAAQDVVDNSINGYLIPTHYSQVAAVMMGWMSAGPWAAEFLADRVILDLPALRAALEALIANSELRARLGQRARTDVVARYALGNVAGAVADVWASQQRLLESPTDQIPLIPEVDYVEVLSQCGARELLQNAHIQVSEIGRPFVGDELRGVQIPDVPLILRPAVSVVLARAANGPLSVAASLGSVTDFGFEAVLWLLKRGYLDIGAANHNLVADSHVCA